MGYVTLQRPGGMIGLRSFATDTNPEAPLCLWIGGRLGTCDAVLLGEESEPRAGLAAAGIPVCSVDYRTHFVTDRDLEACAQWNIGVFLDDVDAAVDAVRRDHPERPLVLVGHSTGAKFALLTASRRPDEVAGVIALDGWLRSPPDTVSADERHEVEALLREWDGGLVRSAGLVVASFQGRPDGQRLQRLFVAHVRNVLVTEPDPYAGRMIGGSATDTTTSLVVRCFMEGDRYWPAIAELEARAMAVGLSGWAAPDYDQGLADLRAPVLNVIAGDRGDEFVARARYSRHAVPQAQVTDVMLKGVGHMDPVVGHHFGDRVVAEILSWCQTTL